MTTIEQVQKAKLKQIHERAVELYGQGEAEKIKQYKKFLIINNTSLTMIQVGEIIDEYMAGVETGKLAHEVYVGKKEQLDVNLEFTKKYTVDIEYLGEVIKFTFEFVGYVKGPTQRNKIKTEREKLLEKKLMAQKEQVEKMDKKKSSGTKLKTPILCVDTGVLYESFTACEKDLGLSKGTVKDFLKGQASRIRTKGYRFMLYDVDKHEEVKESVNGSPVKCLETGEIFETGKAAREWIKKNGFGNANFFYEALKRPEELSCGGFHWMYVDENGEKLVK